MKSYIQKLRLKHDPFDEEIQRDDFFGGGNRDNLVHQVLDRERDDISLDAIIGSPGSGKTRLACRLCESARSHVRPVLISVDLFTTAQRLLYDLLRDLELDPPGDLTRGLESLSEYAIEQTRSGKSILLVMDNAHELGSDCMKLVERLLANRWSAIHLALLGEEQLEVMLRTRLRERYRAKLALHDLPALNRVEIADYIHLKLARAGYGRKLPLSSQAGLDVLQQSEGIPAKINVLTAALLNSDEVPAVGLIFGRRRNAKPPTERPEIRYLWQAFALSLALAVVAFWPIDAPESSASPQVPRSEIQRISLPATSARAPVALPAADPAPANPAAAGLVDSTNPPPAEDESPILSRFEQMLLDAPPDNFTVQILGSTSEEGVREFIAASSLGEIHGYYETRRGRGPWFVVVDGIYPDWETARHAQTRLAGSFDDLDPWIRRISNVHSEISRAGKLGDP